MENIKCPYCGKEMKKGYIQCRDGVYWSEKKRMIAAVPPLTGESIKLTSKDGVFSDNCVQAYNCTECKKIIINY